MPYLSKTPREFLPEALQDAPRWFDNLYSWNVVGYRSNWIEVSVWFPFTVEVMSPSAQEHFRRAYGEFLDCWQWLEDRFQLPFLPEFSMRGECYFFLGHDNQNYRFLMALGKFTIGPRKTSSTSSPSSSPS